ncbi:LuxR C-terminal-related transcriptional regulator [Streptomyces anthocyanicus]|uniref:ATP-binding protein n=1 Tax=Streptomyces anthocyanicus TaxID=68174 RepID=UPI002F9154DB|nr:LuxR C-terminal-related transcriptional regulator [Streptomyces anthocyanicus]
MTQWKWARAGSRNETTGFIGRAAELEAVRRAVTEARVVTLTGLGGVGKTRVAVRAAHQLAVDFPDGVSVAELSGLRDAEFLPNTVASAVGLPEIASTEPMDQLIDHFSDKHALLVLDTCEHLVEAMAMFVDILLSHSSGLVFLLTSRQPVALPGEFVLPIRPMPSPEADADEQDNDALALFVARARAALPSFSFTEENRSEVIALCRRLDGIPLAIELAAVRLRTMPLEQILGRLDDRFRLLAGVRTAQARHHTLRTTIEWSHSLCSEAERELWARLSVFAGGFTLAAAEEVGSGGELVGRDVLDFLGALVDKSVVQRVEGVVEYRYRLLDTIREFGAEQLEQSGRTQEYARRHQDFFLRMAERAGGEWLGDQQVEWGGRLAADFDNFRVAMDFAVAHPADEAALRLVNGLWGLWLGRSRLTEARRWIEKALAAEPEPTVEHGVALYYGSYFGLLQADRATRETVRRCRAVAESLDDDFLRARALYVETYEMLMWSRDVERTMASYEESRRQLRASGDLFPLVAGYINTAVFHAAHGSPTQALRDAEECLRELEHLPRERWARNYMTITQVLALWADGKLAESRDLGRGVLPSALDQGETMSLAATVEFLSWVACAEQDHEHAATLLGGSTALWRQVGTTLWGVRALSNLHTETENTLMLSLGAERFTQVYAHGTKLEVSELIDIACGHRQHTASSPPDEVNGSALGPLTPREREVADLIAEGLTNRQIAERLVISKRTADTHVEHILTKLGVASRVQVAGLVDRPKPAEDRAALDA